MLKNLLFFILSIVAAVFILTNASFQQLILSLGNFEYIGGFIAGFFFVITFTVIPASAVLFVLIETLNPFLLALIAGFGAMCGDYLIYFFFRSRAEEIANVKAIKNHSLLKKLRNLRAIRWLGILVGALIIASPFPDELGIALLGITKLEAKKFLFLSFMLNTVGIFAIVGVGKII